MTTRAEGRCLSAVAAELRSGERDLESYIDQIETRFAETEPEIHAFVEEEGRFERLRREAIDLIGQHPDPEARPPLFGVVVAVKDIFHVEGLPTRAGSNIPAHELAGPEGEAVGRLRQAGALILGKSATTEFAYFAPTSTRNPENPAHTPGGSSSGSAASVSAGLCPLALGTQTIGSISRPAAFCGVVGFKPTWGRISAAGVIPLSPSLDHVGCFVDRAQDAELGASILCRDWRSAERALERPARLRLGVPIGPYLDRATSEGRSQFESTVERLADAGLAVTEIAVMTGFAAIEARHNLILAAEAAQVHGRWYAPHRDLYHPRTAELIDRGLAITRRQLMDALEQRVQLVRELEGPLETGEIDLWISPAATGTAPAGLDWTGDPVMNLPWSQAGLPTLALPSGRGDSGLPFGLQLAALRGDDESLIAAGQRVEEVLQ